MTSLLVSHLCPTWERPERHENLWRCFDASTWPRKELLIADESESEPSPFFRNLRDRRVRYWHVRPSAVPEGKSTIGDKRNFLARQARGDILQHQDDDDWYAPGYTAAMIRRLGSRDLVKLAVFDILHERDGSRWRWDVRDPGGILFSSRFKGLRLPAPFGLDVTPVTLWGFGFSYVYRKSLWERAGGFPDQDRREDYEFAVRAKRAGARLAHVQDCSNLVLHSVHDLSTSTCFPQIRLDGPMPLPVVEFVGGAILGAAIGTALAGPVGAMCGTISACTRTVVRHALATETA